MERAPDARTRPTPAVQAFAVDEGHGDGRGAVRVEGDLQVWVSLFERFGRVTG